MVKQRNENTKRSLAKREKERAKEKSKKTDPVIRIKTEGYFRNNSIIFFVTRTRTDDHVQTLNTKTFNSPAED